MDKAVKFKVYPKLTKILRKSYTSVEAAKPLPKRRGHA